MISYLGKAVAHLCALRHTSARAMAEFAGLHPTLLTRACNGSRLESKSLKALCTSQKSEDDGLALLMAHLRDEVDRAGLSQTRIKIETDDRVVHDNLRILIDEAGTDPELRELLFKMADYVKSRPASQPDSLLFAAERQAGYGQLTPLSTALHDTVAATLKNSADATPPKQS